MKIVRKTVLVLIVTIVFAIMCATSSKATTLKVTADTLNLREKASTDSDILTLMSNGDECELIEEEGDWYKVKYESYTGYVSKEYVKTSNTSSNSDDDNNTVTNQNNDTTGNQNEESNNNDTNTTTNTNVDETATASTGKISKDTVARILPLIHSNTLETLKSGTSISIITELNGWSYIETDSISAWVRSSNIKVDEKKQTGTTTSQDNNNMTNQTDKAKENNNDTSSTTEKTMYVNDSYVNLRKGPSTSADIIMVVGLNTKLTVIDEEGNWYKVKTSEGNAYVSKELLSDKKVTATSRGGTIIRGATENIATKDLQNPEKAVTTTSNNSTTTKTTSSSTSIKGEEIVAYAKKFLGVPYVYGGASSSGFDCSGFTMYVYKKFGISMGHGAQSQAKLGTAVNANKNSASSLKTNLQLGDLVFFLDYETMDEIGHCGIYIGDGKFIHASSGSGYCVKINSLLPGEYYNTRYCAARRII